MKALVVHQLDNKVFKLSLMHGAKMKEFFIRRDVRLFDIFLLKPNKNLVYLKNRTKFDRNMYR